MLTAEGIYLYIPIADKVTQLSKFCIYLSFQEISMRALSELLVLL